MEPARVKCAQESIFWGKYDRFWAKHPNYFGREQKIWYQHIRKPSRRLVYIVVLVRHNTKRARKAIIWPKMTKNVYFGPKLAVLGPKILNLRGRGKVLVPLKTENYTATSFALFLVGHGIKSAKKANIWPKMTKSANFGPAKFGLFGPKIHLFWGGSKTFDTLI